LAYTLQETAQDANIQGRPGLMQPYFKAAREAALRAVALDPGLGLGHKALGALAMAEGKLDQGEIHARKAVELDPSDYHSLVILGDVFAWRADAQSVQAAQNFYRSALAFAPSYWWAHFRLAVADQLSGDLEDAVHHADTGLLLHPDAEFLYVTAADALFWLDRPQAALDRVKAGLTRRAQSPILQLLMAYGAYETGDLETLDTYSRKVQATFAPSHPVHRWAKALQLLGQGDRDGCLTLLDGFRKDAEDLATPGTPTMDARIASVNLYFMGRTLAKLGDRPRATTFLDLAERLHPGKLGVSRRDPAYRALFNHP
jgi:tetratricopeptide (TPR) repeat protein